MMHNASSGGAAEEPLLHDLVPDDQAECFQHAYIICLGFRDISDHAVFEII